MPTLSRKTVKFALVGYTSALSRGTSVLKYGQSKSTIVGTYAPEHDAVKVVLHVAAKDTLYHSFFEEPSPTYGEKTVVHSIPRL